MCKFCAIDAFPALPSRCYRCQRITTDSAVCDTCKRQTVLRRVWVVTEYGGTSKELLRLYKYERTRSAADVIADAMEDILPFLPEDIIIIPVPTASSRIRLRGYDHAVLLAREVARHRKLISVRALTRLSQSRQVGADRKTRLNQLKNDFLITNSSIVKGANILLVDDVVTTGATIETASLVLKNAGAKSVSGVLFAQRK